MSETKTNPVIRALDVGYGNTKYIVSVNNGEAIAAHFPSIVHRPSQIAASLSESPSIYQVEVNGNHYHVGPGLDAVFEGGVRTLNDNFIDTDGYMALAYGAISQMDIDDEIDLLVVGLPVALLRTKRRTLEGRLTGTHSINGRTITIHKTVVVAQPLGGFMSFASKHEDIERLSTARNLLIDPGFFTVDYMASTGLREITGSSGSHSSGMSAYLKGLAKELSKNLSRPYENISHIDEGLRTGTFRMFGKEIDLSQFHEKALLELKPAAEVIANTVGTGEAIDQIVLVGGGAHVFKDLVHAILPEHPVLVAEQSIIANVLGFQMIGESMLSHSSREAA